MKCGLIFDLDGTLVDSLDGIAGSLNRVLAARGLPEHSREAVRGFIGNGSRVLIERAVPDATLVDTLENDFKADYDKTWRDGTAPYAGIPELLETLKRRGHPLAVLSNKPHPFTVEIVASMFPGIRFASVLGQRAGIPHKPDPRGALEIAAELELASADCIVIGDSTMDLETARRAGMRAIAVTWGYHDRPRLVEAGAEILAENPAELADLLD